MAETTSGSDLLDDLAHEFAERHRRGERPSPEDYVARYPHLAEEIRVLRSEAEAVILDDPVFPNDPFAR